MNETTKERRKPRPPECDFRFRLPIPGNTKTTHRCHDDLGHDGDHHCACGRKIYYRP